MVARTFVEPSCLLRDRRSTAFSMGADLHGCLVRTDLRPSLTGLVDENCALPLLAECVGIVSGVLGGDDQRAVAVDIHLIGGGPRPGDIDVVVAAELVSVCR